MGLLDNFTQWAQSPQSQPTADGLLAAGLGILARNRGLNSGWSAVGQGGLDGLQQYQQSKQLQMQQQLQNAQLQQLGFALQKNKLLYNTAAQLLGGDPQTAGAAPQVAPGATDAGGVAAGSGGSGAGVQSYPVPTDGAAPQGVTQQAAPASPVVPAASGAPRSALFGNIPNNLAGFGLLTDPNKLFEIAAGQYSPTDLQKQMTAAGIQQGSPEWNATIRAALTKSTRIEPTSLRPGAPYIGSDGQLHTTPSAAPAGFENVTPDNGQTWSTVPIQGGLNAIRASQAATSGGKAQYELQDVWDPTANGGKGGMVKQTVSNVAEAANGGAPGQSMPAPMRNNNPGAMMPGGKLAQYPDQQTGLQALDSNLQSYGKQGVNTLAGVISKWAPPNENDTQAYIADVSQRLGLKPNQPIDLSQPVVRHALGSAIMLHENGPQGVFGYPGAQGSPRQPAQGGAFAAAPPLGQTSNANAAQAAPADTMKEQYSALQSGSAAAPAALEAIDKMMMLSKRKSPLMAGPLGTSTVATALSPDAAEYEKQRANVIGLIAKQGGLNGTDAGRALVGESVPDYGKPQSAQQDGLQTQRNQIVASQLKTNLLTPAYNSGDSQTFTRLSNEFDQNIKPSMAPILQMPSSDIKRAAVQAAIKANPSLRSNFEWAFNNGLLK
jgi:hypothetical protein